MAAVDAELREVVERAAQEAEAADEADAGAILTHLFAES
jgi:hypothetical protein